MDYTQTMKQAISVVLALWLMSSAAAAMTVFSCAGKRVEGFSTLDLVRYCGKPLLKEAYRVPLDPQPTFPRGTRPVVVYRNVTVYHYVSKRNQRAYAVELERGRVVRVIEGQREPHRPR